MGTFSIEGGHKLKGSIYPQGAKNEALQVICAALLTKDEVIINNIPVKHPNRGTLSSFMIHCRHNGGTAQGAA